MNRILIAGAGAEVDLGFKSGLSFTQDTFYCRKNTLYKALGGFYKKRLGSSRDGLIPTRYDPAFLFNSSGRAFKDLISNLARDNSSYIFDKLGKPLDEIGNGSADQKDLKKLFDEIIVENVAGNAFRDVGDSIPNDSHFGILEQYYSELLDPNAHLCRFWKLINFYWSAFFSITLPISDTLYGEHALYAKDRYAYILDDLGRVVHDMFSREHVDRMLERDCYYSVLNGKFDRVITTNYTPYAASIVDGDENRIAWLSGKLSQFERLPDLEFADYSKPDRHIGEGDFIFPYLLCQSPVKPVISLAQIDEYAKASIALKESDEIVVIGYSFCNEDAHIGSMVGESLRKSPDRKLVYFKYCEAGESAFDRVAAEADLQKKLRICDSATMGQIEVLPIRDCKSDAFVKFWKERERSGV